MNTRRLFVALPLPAPIKLLLLGLRSRIPTLRWTPEEQLHLTLRFLGEVDADRIDPLMDRLRAIRVETFLLPIEGTGAFPPKGPPRVLWAGVGSGHPRLHQLRQRIDDAVLTLGIDMAVRTFHPHVTLARCGDHSATDAQQWLRTQRDFAGPSFAVEAFELYASELHSSGAVHTRLAGFPLAPHAGEPRPS